MDKSSDNVMFPDFCLMFTEDSRLFLSQFLNILQKLSTKKKTVMIHFFMLGYVFDKKTYHNSTLSTLQTQQTPRLFFFLILNSHKNGFNDLFKKDLRLFTGIRKNMKNHLLELDDKKIIAKTSAY